MKLTATIIAAAALISNVEATPHPPAKNANPQTDEWSLLKGPGPVVAESIKQQKGSGWDALYEFNLDLPQCQGKGKRAIGSDISEKAMSKRQGPVIQLKGDGPVVAEFIKQQKESGWDALCALNLDLPQCQGKGKRAIGSDISEKLMSKRQIGQAPPASASPNNNMDDSYYFGMASQSAGRGGNCYKKGQVGQTPDLPEPVKDQRKPYYFGIQGVPGLVPVALSVIPPIAVAPPVAEQKN